jgi:hypothetical protein
MDDHEILRLIANPKIAKEKLSEINKAKAAEEKKRKAADRERARKMKPIKQQVKKDLLNSVAHGASVVEGVSEEWITWFKKKYRLEPDPNDTISRKQHLTRDVNLDTLFENVTDWDEVNDWYRESDCCYEFGYQLENAFQILVQEKLRKILKEVEDKWKQEDQDKLSNKFWSGKPI